MDEASFRYKSTVGKRILIATRTPQGLPGGSGFHLRNMIECLEKSGHKVAVSHATEGAYDAPCYELVIPQGSTSYDAVIVDYSWMCPVLDIFNERILKICFVHDLRCRIIPCLTAIGYQDAQGWTEEKEAALLRKADVLLVLNEDDAAFCRRMAPDAKVIRIGVAMEAVPRDVTKEVAGRCIYVGSNNMENAHALNWFGENVWPKVIAEVPHATLDVVTGHPDSIEQRYAEAQIAVVPHIMNGGLKIKTAEAFAHGHIVIGNNCAFDGFEDGSFSGFDESAEMAEAIIRFLKEDDIRKFYRNSVTGINGYQERMTACRAYGNLLAIL